MDKTSIDALITRYGLISDQVDAGEISIILQNLVEATRRSDGSVVEFGCYIGTTSLYIRRVLNGLKDERSFYAYDSFEGLPEKTGQDSSPAGLQFVAGELRVSKKAYMAEFKKAGLRAPIVRKGWFDELADTDVPEKIAFAFLDGDYYESVKVPLRLIEDKLAQGAVIVIDDYANEALPGAARAVDEWTARHNARVTSVRSLGVIRL